MAVPPYMGCPEKVHWMDSEDTGQWLCNACSQFNWCLLLLSNKVLQPDWMACNFPSKLCFGWRVVRQSRHSSVDSRWIWLLVKPLLYKDKMASAPTQKHLSDGLSEGGVEDFWYKHCQRLNRPLLLSWEQKLSNKKRHFLSGIAQKWCGEIYPCPNLLAHFHHVPEIGTFLLKSHDIFIFLGHFCHHFHQNCHHYYHNYHCNHHYHHADSGNARK